jgi:hypothetical protein
MKKWSWSLEGLDSDGVLLFHRILDKLWDRPKFPYEAVGDENSGHMRLIPSNITFNTVHETKEDYNLFFDYLKKSKVMFLRLHNGNEILETWKFEDLSLIQENLSDEFDRIDVMEALIRSGDQNDEENIWTWDLFYKKATFNSAKIS